MNMRDLIPWGRRSEMASAAYGNEGDPLASFRREVDRLFDDFFRAPISSLGSMRHGAWPNIETSETDREIRITAELPGMNEKDIELLFEDGMLTIRGEKRSETEDRERGYSERFYGRFERRIPLPSYVEADRADASFRDGLLTVTLPKSVEAERGRRIPINGGTRH